MESTSKNTSLRQAIHAMQNAISYLVAYDVSDDPKHCLGQSRQALAYADERIAEILIPKGQVIIDMTDVIEGDGVCQDCLNDPTTQCLACGRVAEDCR